MTNNHLSLRCLVNDKPRSDAFEIEIESTKSVSALKNLIKTEKANDLRDVNPERITLWRASIPGESAASTIVIDALDDKIELDNPSTHLSTFSPESPDGNTYIIVQQPTHASKRDFDGDTDDRDAKRSRPYIQTKGLVSWSSPSLVLPFHERSFFREVHRGICAGNSFVIHGPYQSGKTSFLMALRDELEKKPNEAAVIYTDMSSLYISHDTQDEAAILDALSRYWSYQVFHQELSWKDLTIMLQELRPSPRHYFLVDEFQSVFCSSVLARVAKKFFRNLSSMNTVSCVITGTFKRMEPLLDDEPIESLFNKDNFAKMPPFDLKEMSRLFDLYKEHCHPDISRQIQARIAYESGGHPASFMALLKLTLRHHPDEGSYASMLQKNIRPLLEETQTKLKADLKSMKTGQKARVRDLTKKQMNDWEFIPDDFDRYLLNIGILDSHNDRTVRFTSVVILHICIDVLQPQPENQLLLEEIRDPINLLKLGLQCISPFTVAHPLVQSKFGPKESNFQMALFSAINGLLPTTMKCLIEAREKSKGQIDLMLIKNNRNWVGCELKVNVISQFDFKDCLRQASKLADFYGIPVYLLNFYQEGRSAPVWLLHIPANVAVMNVMHNKGCTRFIITEPDGSQTTVNTNPSI